MVLRAIEGCDGSGSSANGTVLDAGFSQKWDGAYLNPGTTTTDSERFSGTIIYPTAVDAYYDLYLDDEPGEIACGIYIKPDQYSQYRAPSILVFQCKTTTNSTWYHLEVKISSRDILVTRNNGSNLDPIISNVLEPHQWNLIELKTKIHNTTGYWYIYVNGILVGSETDVDTLYLGTPFNRFRFYMSDALASYGDSYLLDLTGGQNNDALGAFHIQGTFPDANGANSDWIPSSAVDHYTLVNEAPPDEADYVESNTPDEQDLYNYDDLTGTWDEIFGVQMNSRVFLDSAGSETASILCYSNGTEDAANFTVDSTTIGDSGERAFQRLIEVDPDTSIAWDTAGIDAAQFGIKFI